MKSFSLFWGNPMNANKTWPLLLALACVASMSLAGCSRKTALEKGTEMATAKLDMATGIGDALQAKGAAAGESVAGGIGTVIKGAERGVMKSGRTIDEDKTVAAAGLKITRVQDVPDGAAAHGFDAYIVSDAAAKGTLRVLVFDALNREIGRTTIPIDRKAEEARYETVSLDAQVDRSAIRKIGFVFKPNLAQAQ
jgi:hypothetical protein